MKQTLGLMMTLGEYSILKDALNKLSHEPQYQDRGVLRGDIEILTTRIMLARSVLMHEQQADEDRQELEKLGHTA